MSTPLPEMTRPELLAALNELLEAERAGARVAREMAAALADADPWHARVTDIQRDELRWCRMLMDLIHDLGATPSALTGDFHAKVMALPLLTERLRLLNRGQAWVVRRLDALLALQIPTQVRSGLQAMKDAHADQIARVEQALQT